MRKLLFSAAALVLATSAGALAAPTSARAADAPVCAVISGDGEATYCNFVSVQQCQAFVAGQSGTCAENSSHWTGAQARYVLPLAVEAYQGPAMRIEEFNPHQP